MKYFRITYEVFGVLIPLQYFCKAEDEAEAIKLFRRKCHAAVRVDVEEVAEDCADVFDSAD